MKEPQLDKQTMDSDSDSAPESVSFNESKSENAIQSSKIKDQVERFLHFFFKSFKIQLNHSLKDKQNKRVTKEEAN
jgi:hypothetical protein